MEKLRRKDLVYPELSYKIIGVLFDVYNKIGTGYHEKYYQRAIMAYLKINNLKLGIIANFGGSELKFKRIINFNS